MTLATNPKTSKNNSTSIIMEMAGDWLPRPAVAREGWGRTGALLGAAGLLWRTSRPTGWPRRTARLLLGLGLLTGYAYRDPQREPIGNALDYIYSPTDGTIISVEQIEDEPTFVGGPAYRVRLASHLLDVPMQRTPLPGLVRLIHQTDSQSAQLGLETVRGRRLLLTYQPDSDARLRLPRPLSDPQIVHLRPQAGQFLEVTRKFAVRGLGHPLLTDLYFSTQDTDILCRAGEHVQAGMTVLARLKAA